ncbi:MAG: hypothetical protein ISS25_01945 [Nanoarchaeota archaeon]|nr:hypothetical protein [DPANN group archaeon]MBL7116568.1 hypothetical protein [Nanoarchaeota archaeon]
MTMKIFTKKNRATFIIIAIIIIIILSNSRTFVPENRIVDSLKIELAKPSELTSCQIDCSLNDGVFHEECIGFNGCEDSSYLRSRTYCEKDSDCVVDLGCCTESCKDDECLEASLCAVSNKEYVSAHSFSCENNIICREKVKCIGSYKTTCFSDVCRIIS